VTKEWLAPRGAHELHRATGGNERVRAWVVKRPDGTWSWLVINKGATAAHVHAGGELHVAQYSRQEYVWHSDRARGHATVNRPPRHFEANGEIALPPFSITVASERRSTPASDARR
jgi:hypothetical protein